MKESISQGGAGLRVAARLFCISRQPIAGHHASNASEYSGLPLVYRNRVNWKRQNAAFPEKYKFRLIRC